MVTTAVVVWQQTAMGHLCSSIKGNQLQKQNNQTEVAVAVVAWQHGQSIKWKRLQEKINWRWQQWWWHGGSIKWKQLNNQPEVAVMAMVTAAVVAWWQTAVRHCHSSMQHKMEVAAKSNQPVVAAAVVHGGSTMEVAENKKEKVNNQLEVAVVAKVAAVAVAWQ